jgi:hypothetical protein
MMRGGKKRRRKSDHRKQCANEASAQSCAGQVLGHGILRNLATAIAVDAEGSALPICETELTINKDAPVLLGGPLLR